MDCELCKALTEDYRLIFESEHSFCVVCKWPLKEGHVMVIPKRCVVSYTDLSPKELYDLHMQVEKVRASLALRFEEAPLMLRNFGRHSTEPHLHIHLFPSKGALRELVSSYEGVPRREEANKEVTMAMRDMMRKALASTKSED